VFALGKAVHKALEIAGQMYMENGELTSKDKKRVLEIYTEATIEYGLSTQVDRLEGQDLVKARLKKIAEGKIIGVEKKFGWDEPFLTEEGVPLIGAIDKLEELSKDTLFIVDYKTSRTAPTSDYLKYDIQLSLYDLVASLLYPEYDNIVLSLDILRKDPVYTYRTKEDREDFKQYLVTVYNAMRALEKKDVKPTLNQFCAWCDFKENCKAYRTAVNLEGYNLPELTTLGPEELYSEWVKIRSIKGIVEGYEKAVNMEITDRIKKMGMVVGNDKEELYLRQNSKKTYPASAVKKLVPEEDFIRLVNIKSSELNKYMAKNPVLSSKLSEIVEVNFTSPFLAQRKLKR